MKLHQALKELTDLSDQGVYIVTSKSGEEQGGCLVAFATQASIDPVRFIVALSHSAHTYGLVEDSAACVMHWLDRSQEDLARAFGTTTGYETDKFESLDWTTGQSDCPILDEAPGYVELEIRHRMPCGDHTAYLGDPLVAEARSPFQPLTVQDVHRLGIRPTL